MPRYDWTCDRCHEEREYTVSYQEIDRRRETGFACPCGGTCRLTPQYRAIFTDRPGIYPMYSPAADQTFASKQEYDAYKRENDLEFTGKGWQ